MRKLEEHKLEKHGRKRGPRKTSANFYPVNSSSESLSSAENSAPLNRYVNGAEGQGQPLHNRRKVPVKNVSKNKRKRLTSRRRNHQKFPKQFTSPTEVNKSGANYSLSALHPSTLIHGVPDGHIGDSEFQNLPSISHLNALKRCRDSKFRHQAPVADNASSFDPNKTRKCNGSCFYREKSPCFIRQTSSSPTRKIILEYMRNHNASLNVYRPFAYLTTYSSNRPYAQSLNVPASHRNSNSQSVLTERGRGIEIISKSIDSPSLPPYPLFCMSPYGISGQMTNFNSTISTNITPESTYTDPSISDNRCYHGTLNKPTNRISTYPYTSPNEISDQSMSINSPCSIVAEVGSINTSPETIPTSPSEAELIFLSESSDCSSVSLPEPPLNSPVSQSSCARTCHIKNGIQSFGHFINSFDPLLMENSVHPKSISKENGQNTILKKGNSLKSSFLCTSKNITHLASKAKLSSLSGNSKDSPDSSSDPRPNSSTSNESLYNQEDTDSFSQSFEFSFNSCNLPSTRQSKNPKLAVGRNCPNNTTQNEYIVSKSSFPYPGMSMYSERQRTPQAITSTCTLHENKNIKNAVGSIYQSCIYPNLPCQSSRTRSSNNSESTNLFPESNYLTSFLVPPNTPNRSLRLIENHCNKNISVKSTQSFGGQAKTDPPQEKKVLENPKKPSSESCHHRFAKARISKFISCFIARFRLFRLRKKSKT